MALTATIRQFTLDIADIDRGVYAQVEQRVAQHPSETDAFLVTRALAYALEYDDALTFGRGVSTADEPALYIKDPTGRWLTWIDVGAPAGERIHRAAKRAERVAIYSHRSRADVERRLAGQTIHRADAIALCFVPTSLIEPLAADLGRRNAWSVVRSGGVVYVTTAGVATEGELAAGTL